MLTELVRKREKEKFKLRQLQFEYLYLSLSPLSCIIRRCVEELKKLVFCFFARCSFFRVDKNQHFHLPVSAEDVPDYTLIIKTPMDFSTITSKVEDFQYKTFEQFEVSYLLGNVYLLNQEDVDLIASNALTYNRPETVYAKAAQKLRTASLDVFLRAKSSLAKIRIDSETGFMLDGIPENLFHYPTSERPPPPSATPSEANVSSAPTTAKSSPNVSRRKKDPLRPAIPPERFSRRLKSIDGKPQDAKRPKARRGRRPKTRKAQYWAYVEEVSPKKETIEINLDDDGVRTRSGRSSVLGSHGT